MQKLSDSYKIELAKSFTELAIQNNLFSRYEDPEETAKDITAFFKTIIETADSETN